MCVRMCVCVFMHLSVCGAKWSLWMFTKASLGLRRSQRAESTLNILTLPYILQLALATCLPFCSEPQCKWALQSGKWAMTFMPKEAGAHTQKQCTFLLHFLDEGKVICIICDSRKAIVKTQLSQVSGGKKLSINQWMWWCPNIALVIKIIPHKFPRFSPLVLKLSSLHCSAFVDKSMWCSRQLFTSVV